MQLNKYIKLTIIIFLGFILYSVPGKAQQDPLYTQYMFNTLAYNPAYAGTQGELNLMALYRHQWVGFEGAPSTQTFTANMPLAHNIGIGLTVIHDKLKPTQQTGFYFDYAYRLKVSEKTKLSLGLKGGFNYFHLNVAELMQSAPNDEALNIASTNKYLPNFGFGAYFYSDRYFLGASVPKLIENKLVNSDIEVLGQEGAEVRHYFITGGYVFNLSNEVVFKPTFMVHMTKAAPTILDANLNFLLKEKLWIGALVRTNNSYGAILQYQFTPQLKVGYAYDMINNELRNYNSGTHEIMVSYEFTFTKDKVQNPRYF